MRAGRFSMEPRTGFRAAAPVTIALRYRAGPGGIGVGGAVKFALPNMGWGEPRTPYPRACPEMAHGGARRITAYDRCDTTARLMLSPEVRREAEPGILLTHRRSYNVIGRYDNWSWWITAAVEGAPLEAGDEIRVLYGDTSFGEAGARVQPWTERGGLYFSAFEDARGDGRYLEAEGSPVECSVAAGPPARCLLTAPSVVRSGSPSTLRLALTDAGWCPVDEADRAGASVRVLGPDGAPLYEGPLFRDAADLRIAVPRLQEGRCRVEVVTAEGGGIRGRSNPSVPPWEGRSLFWGDLHCHTRYHQYNPELGTGHGATSPAELLAYARDVAHLDFAALTDGRGALPDNAGWKESQAAVAAAHEDGRFAAFRGWEIQMGEDGHRNAVYREGGIEPPVDAPVFRDASIFGRPGRGMAGVLEHFRGRADMLLIPHHTQAWMNWAVHDPDLDRLVEIYSCWGSSEHPHNALWDKASLPNRSVRHALGLGYRLGFVGGSDSHTGYAGRSVPDADRYAFARFKAGYTGVWARELTREAVFDALRARRCCATTGARMVGRCTVDGVPMGGETPAGERRSSHSLRFLFAGTDRIARVEAIRDGRTARVWEPHAESVEEEWTDRGSEAAGASYYYLKAVQTDGNTAWLSPVWV